MKTLIKVTSGWTLLMCVLFTLVFTVVPVHAETVKINVPKAMVVGAFNTALNMMEVKVDNYGPKSGTSWLQQQSYVRMPDGSKKSFSIPERTTDFIFAVFAEEFGFAGSLMLLALLLLVIARGLYIAANAPTLFGRLLAGAITLTFFTYAFVNMGMVSGVLPVVGVPLPLISYGGTALVSICLGFGILMSIATHKRLIQT
jgi:hypothetical protein